MGLSSQLAPSAIARPGVIANAAARPASPYQGQVVFQTDTNQAFVWNGSAWVLLSTGTANPPGLEFISATTIGSAVSSVVVSSCFTSTYANYRVLFTAASQSADAYARIQFNNQTGSYYYDAATEIGWTVATATAVAGGPGVTARIGRYVAGLTYIQSSFDVMSPQLTARTWVTGLSSNPGYSWFYSCQEASDTSHTGFTLSPSTGTWSSGTIRVYGYKS